MGYRARTVEMTVGAFWGVLRYEYRMMVRRRGVWLAFAVVASPYIGYFFFANSLEMPGMKGHGTIWQFAGYLALSLNFYSPVVGGIAMADRLARDTNVGVLELLKSAPLSRPGYVLGKYAGTVLGVLTPIFLIYGLSVVAFVLRHGVSAAIAVPALLAFLAITVPAYAFVGAFSIACTAILPVRVYQVLFTAYWFWGNQDNRGLYPTLAGSVLTPLGRFATEAFFDATPPWGGPQHTAFEATLNLGTLAVCAATALVALERYIAWQDRRA